MINLNQITDTRMTSVNLDGYTVSAGNEITIQDEIWIKGLKSDAKQSQYLAREHVLLNSLTEIIKGVRTEELPQRVSELVEKMKGMEKELSSVRTANAMANAARLVQSTKAIGGVNLIVEQLADEISVVDMRSIALDLKSKIKNGVVVLATVVNSKPLIVASVSPEAIKLGNKAGEIS